MTTKVKYKVNTLRHWAEKIRNNVTSEEEIMRNNMTSILEREEEEQVLRGENLIIECNGKVREGKSTMAMGS